MAAPAEETLLPILVKELTPKDTAAAQVINATAPLTQNLTQANITVTPSSPKEPEPLSAWGQTFQFLSSTLTARLERLLEGIRSELMPEPAD